MLLETNQINPRLLRCSYFNGYGFEPILKMSSRVCYDYELEYYVRTDGGIMVDGLYLPFKSGDINIRKPGQIVHGVAPYECYILCITMQGTDAQPDEEYLFGTQDAAQPLYQNELLSALPNKLTPEKPLYIQQLFKEIYGVSRQQTPLNLFKENTLIYELLYELFRQCDYESAGFRSVNPLIIQAVNYINSHFCEEINIMQLVEKSHLSKAYFHKCFREYTKTTPAALILDLRVEKAKTLLCMTNNPISEIAFVCGYLDSVYFSYLFKRQAGSSPTQYRCQHSQPLE